MQLDPKTMTIVKTQTVIIEKCGGIHLEVKNNLDIYFVTFENSYISVLRWTTFSNPIILTPIFIGEDIIAT
jgi:hypothetical protein